MSHHEFANLHAHSFYSFLDGLADPEDMCARSVEVGSRYCAITDHGHCVGHYAMFEAAKRNGIVPILGSELYLKDGVYHNTNKKGFHLTLWARNLEGLHNLWDISSKAWLHEEGKDAYTNALWEDLGERREGVICGSACLAGALSRAAKADDEKMALGFTERFRAIFDEFFIEIHTNSEPEQRSVNMWLLDFAKRHGIRTIYAIDSHYVTPQDCDLQNVMLGCNMGKHYDETHMHMKQDYYMMDEAEVRQRLAYIGDEDLERCFDGVDHLLSMIEEYDLDRSHKVPKFPLPEGWDDSGEYLKYLTAKGLFEKAGGCEVLPDDDPHKIKYRGGDKARLVPYLKDVAENEFPIIVDNGLADYFLIVSDYTRWAKEHGVEVGPGRGSCAASILCWATGITEVDPMGRGLIFSRFLNEGRLDSLPDIDLDFDVAGRHSVVDYLNEKYGKDHVCAVGTVGTFGIKNAFEDLARYYRLPHQEALRCKAILERFDKALKNPKEWLDHLDILSDKERRELDTMMQRFPNVFKYVSRLIGVPRQWGQHAAGYVVSPIPLSSAMPTRLSLKTGDIVAQFDKVAIEALGFLKADLLGLRNLSTLANARAMVEQRHGVRIDFRALEDAQAPEGVWRLFDEGDTLGIFQMGGKDITACAQQLAPRSVMDLSTIVALYRPGVILAGMLQVFINRKLGREQVSYVVPQLEPILKDTYGVIVYQEQSMAICQQVAGYTPLEADHMRSIIGKKKLREMEAEEPKFVEGCVRHSGISAEDATVIFNQIKASGLYSFNKAHSYSYAKITFWTAWMKFMYPVEFYCACFQTVDPKALPKYMREARKKGFQITMPSVTNISDDWAILDDRTIAIGIGSLKGIGEKAVRSIFAGAPYADFEDFKSRSGANNGVVRILVKNRFFREWHPNAKDLLHRFENNDMSANLFGDASTVRFTQEQPDFTKDEIIEMEKSAIGMPLTFDPYEDVLRAVEPYAASICSADELDDVAYEACANVLVLLEDVKRIVTKKGRPMAFLKCDMDGTQIDVTCFTDMWEMIERHIRGDQDCYFLMQVKKQLRNDEDNYVLEHFMPVVPQREREAM